MGLLANRVTRFIAVVKVISFYDIISFLRSFLTRFLVNKTFIVCLRSLKLIFPPILLLKNLIA